MMGDDKGVASHLSFSIYLYYCYLLIIHVKYCFSPILPSLLLSIVLVIFLYLINIVIYHSLLI